MSNIFIRQMEPPESTLADDADIFSVGRAAKLTGLSTHTLRVWERRYGRPRPQRLPSGHRRYTRAEVRWLGLAAEALALGHAASRVATSSEEELRMLLEAGAGREESDFVDLLVKLVAGYRTNEVLCRLERRWSGLEPAQFLDRVLGPLLERIGACWAEGALSIRHEHAGTSAIEGWLERLTARSQPDRPRRSILLATLPGEAHVVGLRMAALICAVRGWRGFYLGAGLAPDEIIYAARDLRVDAVGLSLSLSTAGSSRHRVLHELRDGLPTEVPLLLGGAVVRTARRAIPAVTCFPRMESFDCWLTASS